MLHKALCQSCGNICGCLPVVHLQFFSDLGFGASSSKRICPLNVKHV